MFESFPNAKYRTRISSVIVQVQILKTRTQPWKVQLGVRVQIFSNKLFNTVNSKRWISWDYRVIGENLRSFRLAVKKQTDLHIWQNNLFSGSNDFYMKNLQRLAQELRNQSLRNVEMRDWVPPRSDSSLRFRPEKLSLKSLSNFLY